MFTSIIIIIFSVLLSAQKPKLPKVEVPELKAFQPIAYKIQNEALENYDVAMLVDSLPAIDSGVAKIVNAHLPETLFDSGGLNHIKTKWEKGVKSLQSILNRFKSAIAEKDVEEIIETAEELCGQYEALVWLIHPIPEELEMFYQSLHPIYHEYMPGYNIEKIKLAVVDIQEKMDMLNKVKVPRQLGRIQKVFYQSRRELNKSVKYMVKVTNLIDDEKIVKDAIIEVYEKYQTLEKVFD